MSIPVDEETQRAFEAGEPMLLYVVDGRVSWSRIIERKFTGELDLRFNCGGVRDGRVSHSFNSGKYDLTE